MEMSFQLSAFSFQLVAFSCWLLALGFWRGGGLKPNAARFSQTWDFCIKWWGGPPGPRGTPSSRSSLEESSPSRSRQAGQGAGRGRGRPPHYSCRCAFVGKACGIRLQPAADFNPPAAGLTSFAGGRAEALRRLKRDLQNSKKPLAHARGSETSR